LIDIGLNFCTAYVVDGEVITRYSSIARNYATSWLVPDLASSIPFDWFVYGITFYDDPAETDNSLVLLRVIKCIKLLRLLRVSRLIRYVHKLQEQSIMSSGMIRLIMIVCVMALFSHWNGCLQYMLATFDARTTLSPVRMAQGGTRNLTVVIFHPDSWVGRMEGAGMITANNAWSWSFFTAIAQMLAISLGTMDPQREVEMWGYLLSILVGALIFCYFVASLTAVISEMNASAKAYASKIDMVNHYMRHRQLPRPLREKVRSYFDLVYPSKRAFDEAYILGEVSKTLRQEIAIHKCKGVLDGLLGPIEAQEPGSETARLAGLIAQRLERVVYVAGDTIIEQGAESEGMFFVSSGSLSVLAAGTDDVVTRLGPHSFFGEMSLLHPEGRSVASVRVDTFFEGYRLSTAMYLELQAIHPAIRDYIESVAKLRLQRRAIDTSDVRRSTASNYSFDALVDTMHLGESRHEALRRQIRAQKKKQSLSTSSAASSSAACMTRKVTTTLFGESSFTREGSFKPSADGSYKAGTQGLARTGAAAAAQGSTPLSTKPKLQPDRTVLSV